MFKYSKDIKDNAWKLRKEGKTYNEILKLTSIPKSTLSAWFGKSMGMPFDRKALIQHLANIRPLANKMRVKQRLDDLEEVKNRMKAEVISYPLDLISFQKSILAMLYWAEGSKHEKISGLKFTNTDPKMVDLFVTLLRNCYKPDEAKFYMYLQLHYYHPIRESKKFWSELTGVPISQFHATIMKKRSRKKRFRKNFMGICSIGHSSSTIRKEIMAIAYAIQVQIGKYHVL